MLDDEPLVWQSLLMARSRYRLASDTHHSVSAGILDAIGRGFLIATAGVVAGSMFGTANLAAMGLWTVAVAAGTGIGCMIGSALVRNAAYERCDRKEGASPKAMRERGAMVAMQPSEVEVDVAPVERWTRRLAMNGQQREQPADSGRGV